MANWLDTLALGEYKENFIMNEIRGSELLTLERRDLKVCMICLLTKLKKYNLCLFMFVN